MTESLVRAGLALTRDTFTPGLSRATSATRVFATTTTGLFKSVRSAVFSVRGAIVGLGAYFVTGSIARTVKGFVDAADSAGKFADRIGVGVDFLTRMDFVAERSSVSVDQMRIAIQALQKRIGEFRQTGKGEGELPFSQLGLRGLVASGASVEKVFLRVADALARIPDPARRAFLTMKLFEDGGLALLPVLQQGSRNIESMWREADRLGITLDRSATNSASAFNDALTDLSASIEGLRNKALAPLLPKLTDMVNSFTGWTVENRESILAFFDGLATSVAKVGEVWSRIDMTRVILGADTMTLAELRTELASVNTSLAKGVPEHLRARIEGQRRDIQAAIEAIELNQRVRRMAADVTPRTPPPPAPGPSLFSGTREITLSSDVIGGLMGTEEEVSKKHKSLKRKAVTMWDTLESGARSYGAAIGSNLLPVLDAMIDRTQSATAAARIFGQQVAGMVAAQALSSAFSGLGGALVGAFAPRAQGGGVFRGPSSGYPVTLHGTEGVVPLAGGKYIPVEMRGGGGGTTMVFNVQAMDAPTFDAHWVGALVRNRASVGDVTVTQYQGRAAVRRGMS